MPEKFVILAEERSGSTFLRLWLNNHPEIRCHDEVFKKVGPQEPESFAHFMKENAWRKWLYQSWFLKDWLTAKAWFFPQSHYIDRFLQRLYDYKNFPLPWTSVDDRMHEKYTSDHIKQIGFKLVFRHVLFYEALRKLLKDPQLKIIYLIRENVLDTVLSFLMASANKQFHSEQSGHTRSVTLNPEEVLKVMRLFMDFREQMEALLAAREFHSVTYEEITGSDKATTRSRILNYLNVEDTDVPEPALKKLSGQGTGLIQNLDEIHKLLRNHGYGQYIK